MDIPKSKSWIEPTPKNIKKIANEFGLKNGEVPKLSRRKDETDQELYVRYIIEITGHEPCLICNGPRERKLISEEKELIWQGRKQVWPEEWSAPKCKRYRIHDAALALCKTEAQIERALGPICNEHGLFISECPECAKFHIDEKK